MAPAPPQSMTRDEKEEAPVTSIGSRIWRGPGGPESKCQTREEAEAWAKEWEAQYKRQPHDDDLYFMPQRLYELLEPLPDGSPAPVQLLKGSWVLKRAEQLRRCKTDDERARLRMPRRQELPAEAFLSAAEVRALPRGHAGYFLETCGLSGGGCARPCFYECACCIPWRWPTLVKAVHPLHEDQLAKKPLMAASISHGWLTSEHPDPLGQQLVRFADQVRYEQQVCAGGCDKIMWKRSFYFVCCCGIPCFGQPCCKPPTAFSSGEFAVFYDWGSLMQKNEHGERTEAEYKSFDKALETMGVWYAHRLLTTFIMSELPEGWPKTEAARPFFPDGWLRDKGWPSFERAVSALIKPANSWSWQRIVQPGMAHLGMISGYRAPPLAPQAFATELALKVFTNGADVEMVAGLYADTVAGAIGNIDRLVFNDCEWKDEDAERLAEILPLAKNATALDVSMNRIGTRGFGALAAAIRGGAAPQLETVKCKSGPQPTSFNPGDKTALRAACEARNIKFFG